MTNSAVLSFVFLFSACASHSVNDPNSNEELAVQLKTIRQQYKIPALCAMAVTSEGPLAVAAVGFRKAGVPAKATVHDLWHLGSDTKVMTAALVGRLVEQNKLRWDSTLAEVFPELEKTMHPDKKDVTVLHLLSHRAGLEANYAWPLIALTGSVAQQRYAVVQKAVTEKPKYAIGSEMLYSNVGYVVVGAMTEKVTGRTWEEQMRTEIFEPLEMTTAGFGGVGTPGQVDQPWSHFESGMPAGNGPACDNPAVIGPAGTVHCSIEDWGKFISDQLKGAMGKPALLKPETYAKIQTPPFGGDYALGWIVTQRDWAGGTAFNHGGSNTMNYANVWVAPEKNFAMLICTNQGGDQAFEATDDTAAAMIKLFMEP